MPADVKNIDGILRTIAEVQKISADAARGAVDAQNKAQKIDSEAAGEERNSKQKLEQAKQREQTANHIYDLAKAAVIALEIEIAGLTAGLPGTAPALAAAVQKLNHAEKAEKAAYKAYQIAKKYRELMEARYKLAQTCRLRAAAMLAKLMSACANHVPKAANLTNDAVSRLEAAKGDLDNFHSHAASGVNITVPQSRPTPAVQSDTHEVSGQGSSAKGEMERNAKQQKQVEKYREWRDYQEKEAIVRPDKIHDRLNPSEDVLMGMLQNRYDNDPNFRNRVDDFRQRISSGDPNQLEYVKTQSKKNMAGSLSEDVIKDALSPFATKVDTQVQQVLGDGGYTKIDLVLEDMKQPVVFGKGERMFAPKGGSVAIEVKAGQDEYLRAQKSHLDRQVQGHQNYDVSLILCTRDIKELSSEQEYRDDIKELGSRIIGMLPRKDEINDMVWRFLEEGVK